MDGLGVGKDQGEGVKWYRKAAEQGFMEAQHNLGLCYYTGVGIAKDATEAANWFRKAAQQGKVQSQLNLGVCYAEGEGVGKDYVEAYMWFSLAAAQGNEHAKVAKADLARMMTPEQIAKGFRRVRDFKPDPVVESGTPASGL
jgi:TPR repeat protein